MAMPIQLVTAIPPYIHFSCNDRSRSHTCLKASVPTDLTGLFWTRRDGRIEPGRRIGHAERTTFRCRADCHKAAADRGVAGSGQEHRCSLKRNRYRWRKEYGGLNVDQAKRL